jgi:hypothetical protein
MEGCGKTVTDPTVFTSEGKEKPRHGAVISCGRAYPSDNFSEWVFFCKSCAVKAGVIW